MSFIHHAREKSLNKSKDGLRLYFIISILIDLGAFLWIFFTPSISTDYFLYNFSLKRFLMLLAVGIILLAHLIGFLKLDKKSIHTTLEKILNNNIVFLTCGLLFIITLIISIQTILGLQRVDVLFFLRILPISIWVNLISLETLIWQYRNGTAIRCIETIGNLKINRKHLVQYCIIFTILYIFWGYKMFISARLSGGLDPSWMMGLNWASRLGLKWTGASMIFTYGPLYFLTGLLNSHLYPLKTVLLTHLGLNLVYYIFTLAVFIKFIELFIEKGIGSLFLIPVAMILFYHHQDFSLLPFLLSIILISTFSREEQKIHRLVVYILSGMILAGLSLAKFTNFYLFILFLALLVFYNLCQRRIFEIFLLIISYCGSLIAAWLFSGQSVNELIPYILITLKLSGSYSEVLMLNDVLPSYWIALSYALFIFMLICLGFISLIRSKSVQYLLAWLLPTISLFIAFKNSFVRADLHVLMFFQALPIALITYSFILIKAGHHALIKGMSKIRKFSTYFFSCMVMISFLLIMNTIGGYRQNLLVEEFGIIPSNPIKIFLNVIHLAAKDPNIYKETIQQQYSVNSGFMNSIKEEDSVDIMPWDIALLYAYDLKWTPRPVLQTYSSFTKELSKLDASWFLGENAPDQLILSLDSIDNRYPIFDYPDVLRALLDRYDIVTVTADGHFTLLRLKNEYDIHELEVIKENSYTLSDQIFIPQIPGSYVYMNIEMEQTLLGKLFNIFYKPPLINVVIRTDDGEHTYRYIRDLGWNGIFISKFIQNMKDLESIFSGEYDPDIIGLHFEANPLFYQNEFKVRFYKSDIE